MKIEVFPDAETAARRAAGFVAAQARRAVGERNRFTFATSGGTTPGCMLQALAGEDLPWHRVHLLQVDERIAPAGHEDRNLTLLHDSLSARGPCTEARVHAMPVEDEDLDAAAARYARTIESICGSPPVLDVIHLGLGTDGHTASLVPDDAVLDVDDKWVALTRPYQGRRRMTLTYPALDGARSVLWLVTGAGKADMLARLMAGDAAVPAGRVRSARAIVFADTDAAASLPAR